MKWLKKGLLYTPSNKIEWAKTHAQVPTVLVNNDTLRVFFAARPRPDLSLTTYIDLDINDFDNVLYEHPNPILDLGGIGEFDEHGIMPSSIIKKDGVVYLYYSGWSKGQSLPYQNYTGLAISEDGGDTFEKVSKGPVIDRTPFEIYSATSPCVYYEKEWHMWYSSGTHWFKINDKYEHTYEIKYASSSSGKKWNQTNATIIPQKNKFEALTRPTVIKLNGIYHMWFSYRGSNNFRKGPESYRIGYAYSDDLISWNRRDAMASIKPSEDGWDSRMIAYPEVKKINKNIMMFYNGNDFGRNGFGYALLDESRH